MERSKEDACRAGILEEDSGREFINTKLEQSKVDATHTKMLSQIFRSYGDQVGMVKGFDESKLGHTINFEDPHQMVLTISEKGIYKMRALFQESFVGKDGVDIKFAVPRWDPLRDHEGRQIGFTVPMHLADGNSTTPELKRICFLLAKDTHTEAEEEFADTSRGIEDKNFGGIGSEQVEKKELNEEEQQTFDRIKEIITQHTAYPSEGKKAIIEYLVDTNIKLTQNIRDHLNAVNEKSSGFIPSDLEITQYTDSHS